MSCLHALTASGIVVHTGTQISSFHFQPQVAGEGIPGRVSVHVPQTPAWYATL